jgi:hypothetical protein
MKWSLFPIESGNMKTIFITNKFLNGMIRGQEWHRNKQLLLCNPWPTPDNMPNLDLPQSTQLNSGPPSVFECPKENLREIFRSFYNQVFYICAADICCERSQSLWESCLYPWHESRQRQTNVSSGMSSFSPETSSTSQSVCQLQVYEISPEALNTVSHIGCLENRNMGQTPVPFLNPAELADRYV